MSNIPENDLHEMLTFGKIESATLEVANEMLKGVQLPKIDDVGMIAYRDIFPRHDNVGAFGNSPANPKDAIGSRKVPYSVIPETVMAELGVAMLEGACKYGRYNFRVAPVRASVYYDALRRHIGGWWEGQDIDPDSLLPHITKGIATLVVLRDAIIQGSFIDDRPPSSKPFFDARNKLAAEIIDRHADKNPRHYTIADTGMKL